jgi:carboxymethylenebutenolidase
MSTTTVDVATPDGTADALLVTPDGDGPHPAVLLYMDAFGVRPRLQQMAERIAAQGYVVLVPNVFHRAGRAPVVDLEDLMKPENRPSMMATLGPLMQALTPERAVADAGAYLDFLAAHPAVADGPVGTTGYCMGGALSLRTAAAYPGRVAAAASFHGGNLATEAPDSPHLGAATTTAEVYVAHADADGSAPPEQQERLEAALTDAGVLHRTELYEGTTHGFTMADTAAYSAEAEERHWTELLALCARNL